MPGKKDRKRERGGGGSSSGGLGPLGMFGIPDMPSEQAAEIQIDHTSGVII